MGAISFSDGLFMVVNQCPKAPGPFPLNSGFSDEHAYRVLGIYNPSETSEAYFILSNDKDEIWFVSNRHLRFYDLQPRIKAPRIARLQTGLEMSSQLNGESTTLLNSESALT